MASSNDDEHELVPYWAEAMLKTLNDHYVDRTTSHAASIYWSVSRPSFQGLLVRVRTALAELVAELITLTPEDQDVPDKLAADQAVQFVINGDRDASGGGDTGPKLVLTCGAGSGIEPPAYAFREFGPVATRSTRLREPADVPNGWLVLCRRHFPQVLHASSRALSRAHLPPQRAACAAALAPPASSRGAGG